VRRLNAALLFVLEGVMQRKGKRRQLPHSKITSNSSPPLPHLRALPCAASNHTSRSTCAHFEIIFRPALPSHPDAYSTDKASPHKTTRAIEMNVGHVQTHRSALSNFPSFVEIALR